MLTDSATALAWLQRTAQASVYPTLDTATCEAILAARQEYTVWAADTAYTYGDRVVPTTPDGHAYRCVGSGTSGATAPDWPGDGTFSDGTAVWETLPAQPDSLWDLRGAAYDAWNAKAGIAVSGGVRVTAGSLSVDTQSVAQACREMAARYAPVGVS